MRIHQPGPGGWEQLSLDDAVEESCIPGEHQGWTDEELAVLVASSEMTETTEPTADGTDRKDDAEGGEE